MEINYKELHSIFQSFLGIIKKSAFRSFEMMIQRFHHIIFHHEQKSSREWGSFVFHLISNCLNPPNALHKSMPEKLPYIHCCWIFFRRDNGGCIQFMLSLIYLKHLRNSMRQTACLSHCVTLYQFESFRQSFIKNRELKVFFSSFAFLFVNCIFCWHGPHSSSQGGRQSQTIS